jgi:hypothetical protein
MEFTVLVHIDAAGECPVLVRDGDDLFPGPDVRFRLVGETDDFGQAIAWMEAEHARCYGQRRLGYPASRGSTHRPQ